MEFIFFKTFFISIGDLEYTNGSAMNASGAMQIGVYRTFTRKELPKLNSDVCTRNICGFSPINAIYCQMPETPEIRLKNMTGYFKRNKVIKENRRDMF